MADLLLAESLCAVTGLWPSKAHPSDTDLMAASAYVATLVNRVRRWMRSADDEDAHPRPFELVEPPSEESLQKKILDPIEPEEEARLVAPLVHDLETADAYLECIKRGRAYLDTQWPKISTPGPAADVFPLSREDMCDVWFLARVLDDPNVLIDELESHTLTIPMVEAFNSVYPTLAAKFIEGVGGLIIDRIASKKRFTWQQDDLLRLLCGGSPSAVLQIQIDKPQNQQQAAQP